MSWPMKALSVRNPWAWAICHAGKRIENRDWGKGHGYGARNVGFRGEVLIHASMRPNPTQMEREAIEFRDFCRERGILLPDGATPGKLTLSDLFRDCGAIVGVVNVDDIRPNGPSPSNPWAVPGLLGLVLSDVRPLPKPVPCKGALGFWKVPDGVQTLVDEQLRLLKLQRHAAEDHQEMKELGA